MSTEEDVVVAPHTSSRGDAPLMVDVLTITGYFLNKHILNPHNRALPITRNNIIAYIKKTGLRDSRWALKDSSADFAQ